MRWLVLVSSIAGFVVAAKAHGRQLRLERELAGTWEVHFGGQNPPFVEALWHRERVWFWTVTLALGVSALLYVAIASRTTWPRPLGGGWWSVVLPPVLWAPLAAFVACGLASLVRLYRAVPNATPSQEWLGAAWSGSVVWWAITFAVVALVAVASWRTT
jgi:hypothetical protein